MRTSNHKSKLAVLEKISGGSHQNVGIVLKQPERSVARVAQKSPHSMTTPRVIMVYTKVALNAGYIFVLYLLASANSTTAALRLEHVFVFIGGQAVDFKNLGARFALRRAFAYFCLSPDLSSCIHSGSLGRAYLRARLAITVLFIARPTPESFPVRARFAITKIVQRLFNQTSWAVFHPRRRSGFHGRLSACSVSFSLQAHAQFAPRVARAKPRKISPRAALRALLSFPNSFDVFNAGASAGSCVARNKVGARYLDDVSTLAAASPMGLAVPRLSRTSNGEFSELGFVGYDDLGQGDNLHRLGFVLARLNPVLRHWLGPFCILPRTV